MESWLLLFVHALDFRCQRGQGIHESCVCAYFQSRTFPGTVTKVWFLHWQIRYIPPCKQDNLNFRYKDVESYMFSLHPLPRLTVSSTFDNSCKRTHLRFLVLLSTQSLMREKCRVFLWETCEKFRQFKGCVVWECLYFNRQFCFGISVSSYLSSPLIGLQVYLSGECASHTQVNFKKKGTQLLFFIWLIVVAIAVISRPIVNT